MNWTPYLLGLGGGLAALFFARKLASGILRPTPSVSSFVQAKHFKAGPRTVDLLVLHSTENDCRDGVARQVAQFFATQDDSNPTSAHYVVGPDETIQCVKDEDIAWHAPPANEHGIGIEMVGRAKFSEDEWTSCGLVDRVAALLGALAVKWNVPLSFVDAAGLLAGKRGVTSHAEVAKAFHKTDHTDPGPGFPVAELLQKARGYA